MCMWLKVGPAGFEPTTFTQEPHEAVLYGFLHDRSRNSSFSKRSQQTRVCLLSGARRHTYLDYDPNSRHRALIERA